MVYQTRFRNDPDLEDMYARQRAASYRLGKAQFAEEKRRAVEQAQAAPMSGALTGASIGGMTGTPVGMAIGGAIGLLAGGAKDVAARREAGEGWGSALGHTFIDANNPANLLRGGNAMKAASVAARGKSFAGNTGSNLSNVDLSNGMAGGSGGPQGEFGSFGEESSYWDSRVAEANNEMADTFSDKWGTEMGDTTGVAESEPGDFSSPRKKWPWEEDETVG